MCRIYRSTRLVENRLNRSQYRHDLVIGYERILIVEARNVEVPFPLHLLRFGYLDETQDGSNSRSQRVGWEIIGGCKGETAERSRRVVRVVHRMIVHVDFHHPTATVERYHHLARISSGDCEWKEKKK